MSEETVATAAEAVESVTEAASTTPEQLQAQARENVQLKQELQQMRQRYLTREEQSKLELSQRENALASREAALTARENRIYAESALQAAGLCSNTLSAADLLPFVQGTDNADTDSKVAALAAILDKRAQAENAKFYKGASHQPKQVNGTDTGNGSAYTHNTARMKQAAHAAEIRRQYTGS
ncbi:MAG: DUF4355 domain-containing protein [Ruminococcus sp.]|nr:DUF4355 domain-containing protein [Ruminococcus sp.]